MAMSSRNYIMSRRGAGISNLQNMTMENGDLTLDQAEAAGMWVINCTHQIGIATSTEVGLAYERYPIRVIIVGAATEVPAAASQTVCAYWRVVDAGDNAIPFARKPLASDTALANLYRNVRDIDDLLWAAAERLRTATIVTTADAAVTTASEALYNVLQLVNPTVEQLATIRAAVVNIIDLSVAGNRYPRFMIGDNVFLKGEPHGRDFAAIGPHTAATVSIREAALCAMVNHQRMKRRYPTVNDGAVTLAAYAAAGMFRHGLFENHEHKEYYTMCVTPNANDKNVFTISSISAPSGAPAIGDFVVGSTLNLANIKIKAQLVELGLSCVMGAGSMHYLFNHTTGGNVLTGALLTTMAMYQFITPDMAHEAQVKVTEMMYEALHPVNKRAIANLFFRNSGVTTHGRCVTSRRFDKFSLDSFMTIRSNPYPAGSHKAFICLQGLRRVLQSGLAPLLPWAERIDNCITTCREVLNSGARAHIGSAYYTGEPPRAQPASLDEFLPEIAMYVHTFNKGDSLSMSPHLSMEISKRSSMNWQNLLKDLKAKDVSATSVDTVRQFLATSGGVHFAFDPEDQTTWGAAVTTANVALRSIDSIFL